MHNASSGLTAAQMAHIRCQYPALRRHHGAAPMVYLDGPAGTQVPQCVADAVRDHLLWHNANHDGLFATSRENDLVLEDAYRACADLVGANDAHEIAFGGNMTTMTMHLSRALSRTWSADDEIIVTRLDHDANVRPWVLAAQDAGAQVHFVPVHTEDCTLDMAMLERTVSERTRLIAVGAASNSVGTINPIARISELAKRVGTQVFVDAVHYAPHGLIDVEAWGCDYLACSAYKFFGPHVGILWGRRELLESVTPYKLHPAPESLPGRWQTGTQNFSAIAGTLAAIDYLADLGREFSGAAELSRRAALASAYETIETHERHLIWRLIEGLGRIEGVRVCGITDPARAAERMPTISLVSDRLQPAEMAQRLADHGVCAWHGHYYAWELHHVLEREPHGMLRLGVVHYNTADEVDRTVELLHSMHA